MRLLNLVIPLAGLAAMLALTGCPGGHDTPSYEKEPTYTTKIRKDDVSDLNDPQIAGAINIAKIVTSCSATCALNNLVEHDDFFSIAFELLAQNVRVFSFRSGWGRCALTLTGLNGGMVKYDTYNKFDPDQFAEVKHLQFTVSKSNATGDYCVPNGSVWEKVESTTKYQDQLIHLVRADQPTGDEIYITTYKGWKGTLMARKSGVIHPMACQ